MGHSLAVGSTLGAQPPGPTSLVSDAAGRSAVPSIPVLCLIDLTVTQQVCRNLLSTRAGTAFGTACVSPGTPSLVIAVDVGPGPQGGSQVSGRLAWPRLASTTPLEERCPTFSCKGVTLSSVLKSSRAPCDYLLKRIFLILSIKLRPQMFSRKILLEFLKSYMFTYYLQK